MDKFRITIGLACNANGSEKLPPLYIGRAKKPRCFGRQSPEQQGFYYRSNKKAWMTAVLFEDSHGPAMAYMGHGSADGESL